MSDETTTEREYCRRCPGWDGAHDPMGDECQLPHRYTNRWHPPRATVGWCCRPCVERHRAWLTEIVDLYAGLDAVLLVGSLPDDTANRGGGKKAKAPASPSPLRLDAWALLFGRLNSHVVDVDYSTGARVETLHGLYLGGNLPDVPTVLQGWAEWSIESGATDTGARLGTVSGAALQLRAVADHIAGQPWIDDFDAELAWLRRALRNAHGVYASTTLGDCISVNNGRDCGGSVRPRPGKQPKCSRCGREYDTHDLVRLKLTNEQAKAS